MGETERQETARKRSCPAETTTTTATTATATTTGTKEKVAKESTSTKRPRPTEGIKEKVAKESASTKNDASTKLKTELARIGQEKARRQVMEQQKQSDYEAKGLTRKGLPRKKSAPKRTLPPQLQQLYEKLESNQVNTVNNEQERITAQNMLQEAQSRLQVAHRQATLLAQEKISLEERLFEGELAIECDFTHFYRLLLKFKQEHGHCNIPGKEPHKALAAWAKKIRRIRAQYQQGEHYQQAPWNYYMKALEQAGFVWDALRDQWQSQFDKMVAFKLTTGHCCVPKTYAQDKSLGAWVHRQRYHYKLFHEGKPTQLTPERIDLLNSVGFSWTGLAADASSSSASAAAPIPTRPKRGSVKRTPEQEWEFQFLALKAFHAEHGHCRVSSVGDQNRNNKLRDWVAWQRREYKRWKQGEPSHVTSEHVRRLGEIGFNWTVWPKTNKENVGKNIGDGDGADESGNERKNSCSSRGANYKSNSIDSKSTSGRASTNQHSNSRNQTRTNHNQIQTTVNSALKTNPPSVVPQDYKKPPPTSMVGLGRPTMPFHLGNTPTPETAAAAITAMRSTAAAVAAMQSVTRKGNCQ